LSNKRFKVDIRLVHRESGKSGPTKVGTRGGLVEGEAAAEEEAEEAAAAVLFDVVATG
jgi:hypothetical protein